MNALASRDRLFSELHAEAFKARGFKKRGHWLVRELGPLVQTAYLRASRFSSSDEAVFWIDIQIFSESWLGLVFPLRPGKIPNEGTPSLFSQELGAWCTPPLTSHRIKQEADAAELLVKLASAAKSTAIPSLDSCETPANLLATLVASASNPAYLAIVGLSRMLGHEQQAQHFMALAKQEAAHENELRFLQLREEAIWRNAV